MASDTFITETTARLKKVATAVDGRQDQFWAGLKELNALRIPLFVGAGTLALVLGVAAGYQVGRR